LGGEQSIGVKGNDGKWGEGGERRTVAWATYCVQSKEGRNLGSLKKEKGGRSKKGVRFNGKHLLFRKNGLKKKVFSRRETLGRKKLRQCQNQWKEGTDTKNNPRLLKSKKEDYFRKKIRPCGLEGLRQNRRRG